MIESVLDDENPQGEQGQQSEVAGAHEDPLRSGDVVVARNRVAPTLDDGEDAKHQDDAEDRRPGGEENRDSNASVKRPSCISFCP